MRTLAERIAAKKAAEAAAKAGVAIAATEAVRDVKLPDGTVRHNVGSDNLSDEDRVSMQQDTDAARAEVNTVQTRPRTQAEAEAQAKEEVKTTDAAGKPLSGFALMQLRKKRIAELMLVPVVEGIEDEQQTRIANSGRPATESNSGEGKGDAPDGQVAGQSPVQAATASVPVSKEQSAADAAAGEEAEEAYAAATPEARQAYADIKPRLDSLVSMSGEDLKGAMQELKTALMKNPNAVQLMLPSDIGQMVIALRKMTGVELAAKAAGKATGTRGKKKEIALTAEELDKAWEEL